MKPYLAIIAGLLLTSCATPPPGDGAEGGPASAPGRTVAAKPGPEAAAKAFLYAFYACDAAEYQAWIVPEPGSAEILGTQRPTDEELATLRTQIDGLNLSQATAFNLDGSRIRKAGAACPVGTKTSYMTGFRGAPFLVPMLRTAAGWRVDVRFWLAMKRMATAPMQESDPEIIAKAFLFHILAKEPEKLAALADGAIDGKAYTAANHLPGGDLDQILSLCIEMPIARARAGEAFRLPSGELVRGDSQADRLVLVGLMGPVEIPFVLKRRAGGWKIVPQRYFEWLRARGAV